MPKIVADGQF